MANLFSISTINISAALDGSCMRSNKFISLFKEEEAIILLVNNIKCCIMINLISKFKEIVEKFEEKN